MSAMVTQMMMGLGTMPEDVKLSIPRPENVRIACQAMLGEIFLAWVFAGDEKNWVFVVALVIQLGLLAWVYTGKNWARWIMATLFCLGFPFRVLFALTAWWEFIPLLLGAVGVVLLFTASSRAWFRRCESPVSRLDSRQ